MADVNLGGLDGSFGGFNLGRIAAQQRAESAIKAKLDELKGLEDIQQAKMANEVTLASLPDLKAKQGITNRYNESMTRNLDSSTQDKQFELGVKQGLGSEFFQEQARGDESDKKLKRMQKMGGLLSSVGAAMQTTPVEAQAMAFENVAGMSGFPRGFVDQVKSGYKGDKPFAQYLQEMGERFANASPEELSKRNDDTRRTEGRLKEISAQGDQNVRLEQERRRTRLEAAQAKASLGGSEAKNKNFEQAATSYYEAAREAAEAGDSANAQKYLQAANQMRQLAIEKQSAAATINQSTKPNIPGLETRGAPEPTQLNVPGQQAPAQQSAAPKAPQPGTVMKGYRFKGGNPADKANWEKVQ